MSATPDTATSPNTSGRLPRRLHAAWQRLPAIERYATAAGSFAAVGLLVALAQTCQQSVINGQRFRAEQRLGGSSVVATASPGLDGRLVGGMKESLTGGPVVP